MSTPTQEEILRMARAAHDLDELARTYWRERYDVDPEWQEHFSYNPYIESLDIDADTETIEIVAEARACGRGCCGYDRHTFSIPLSYLWLDQSAILEDMRLKAEEEKKQEAIREKKEAERQAAYREKQEREQLRKLSRKYGGDS
jgi:hypothetical protein